MSLSHDNLAPCLHPLREKIPAKILEKIPEIQGRLEALGYAQGTRSLCLRWAHFLSQCAHESGNFRCTVENLNYSPGELRRLFGSYFSLGEEVALYAHKPEKIASRIYGGRMGNGDEASGDGYRYRGRGYLQLTGRDNYRAFSRFVGQDCVENPPWVATRYALLSGAFFFEHHGLWSLCDEGSGAETVAKITRCVNGGTHGLEQRMAHFQYFWGILRANGEREGILRANGEREGILRGNGEREGILRGNGENLLGNCDGGFPSPIQGPSNVFSTVFTENPTRSPHQSPEKGRDIPYVPATGSTKNLMKSITQGPSNNLDRVPNHGPGQNPANPLDRIPNHGPGQNLANPLDRVPNHGPGQNLANPLDRVPNHGPGQNPANPLGKNSHHGPAKNSKHDPIHRGIPPWIHNLSVNSDKNPPSLKEKVPRQGNPLHSPLTFLQALSPWMGEGEK